MRICQRRWIHAADIAWDAAEGGGDSILLPLCRPEQVFEGAEAYAHARLIVSLDGSMELFLSTYDTLCDMEWTASFPLALSPQEVRLIRRGVEQMCGYPLL